MTAPQDAGAAAEVSTPAARLLGDEPGWRPTRSLSVLVSFAAAMLVLAVMLRRVDYVVLALPILIGVTMALLRRPHRLPQARLRATGRALLENQVAEAVVDIASADQLDVVCVRINSDRWLASTGRPERVTAVAAGGAGEVRVRLRSLHWGRHCIGPAVVEVVGAHGLLRRGPLLTDTLDTTTLPLREGFGATDVVPRAVGMVGLHRSARPGEGADLIGVRPFVPGDKLRRINWPVSLRAGGLHVTATLSDRDTTVVLVLDTRFDFGVSEGILGASSSLDTTVRAAAAIAEHYLRHGDRVGLIDLRQAVHQIRPAAGRAHLMRLLDVLLDVRAGKAEEGFVATMALGALPPGALVIMLSPLVGDAAVNRAASIARSGRPLMVIDTLPEGFRPPRRSEWSAVAYRVWQLERAADIGRLAEFGVPVVPWRGAGSLDQVLRDVSRAAIAPKAIR